MDYAFETLLVSLDDHVLQVSLNRPECGNAFNPALEREIDRCLDMAELDAEVRAVLVRGEGEMFSAGHDLAVDAEEAKAYLREYPDQTPSAAPALHRAWYFRKPLIAAVHRFLGPAAIALVSCADIIIAAEGTRFSGEVFRRIGAMSPPPHWTQLYVQLPMRALEKLWLFGGWMDAQEALQFHFVQRVVAKEQLIVEAMKFARHAARLPAAPFAHAKDEIRRAYEMMGLTAIPALQRPRGSRPRPTREETMDYRALAQVHGVGEAARIIDTRFDDDVSRV